MKNPDRIAERLKELGDDYADKNAAASLREEMKKVVLAKLINDCPNQKSIAAATEWALAHPDYETHLRSMVEARRAADKAKTAYVSCQSWIDLIRTQESTNRAKIEKGIYD